MLTAKLARVLERRARYCLGHTLAARVGVDADIEDARDAERAGRRPQDAVPNRPTIEQRSEVPQVSRSRACEGVVVARLVADQLDAHVGRYGLVESRIAEVARHPVRLPAPFKAPRGQQRTQIVAPLVLS